MPQHLFAFSVKHTLPDDASMQTTQISGSRLDTVQNGLYGTIFRNINGAGTFLGMNMTILSNDATYQTSFVNQPGLLFSSSQTLESVYFFSHVKASWSSFVPPVPTTQLQLHNDIWCEDSADTSKSSCMAYHVYPFTSGTVHVSDGCEDHALCGSVDAPCLSISAGMNQMKETKTVTLKNPSSLDVVLTSLDSAWTLTQASGAGLTVSQAGCFSVASSNAHLTLSSLLISLGTMTADSLVSVSDGELIMEACTIGDGITPIPITLGTVVGGILTLSGANTLKLVSSSSPLFVVSSGSLTIGSATSLTHPSTARTSGVVLRAVRVLTRGILFSILLSLVSLRLVLLAAFPQLHQSGMLKPKKDSENLQSCGVSSGLPDLLLSVDDICAANTPPSLPPTLLPPLEIRPPLLFHLHRRRHPPQLALHPLVFLPSHTWSQSPRTPTCSSLPPPLLPTTRPNDTTHQATLLSLRLPFFPFTGPRRFCWQHNDTRHKVGLPLAQKNGLPLVITRTARSNTRTSALISLSSGSVAFSGDALDFSSKVTLKSSSVIEQTGGNLAVSESTVGNVSKTSGNGGVLMASLTKSTDSLSITSTTFRHCSAGGSGGVLFVSCGSVVASSQLIVRVTSFDTCSSGSGKGGCVFVSGSSLASLIAPASWSGHPTSLGETESLFWGEDARLSATPFSSATLLVYLVAFSHRDICLASVGQDVIGCGRSDLPCETLQHSLTHLSTHSTNIVTIDGSASLDFELETTRTSLELSGKGETKQNVKMEDGGLITASGNSLALTNLHFSTELTSSPSLISLSSTGSLTITSCSFSSFTCSLNGSIVCGSVGSTQTLKLWDVTFKDCLSSVGAHSVHLDLSACTSTTPLLFKSLTFTHSTATVSPDVLVVGKDLGGIVTRSVWEGTFESSSATQLWTEDTKHNIACSLLVYLTDIESAIQVGGSQHADIDDCGHFGWVVRRWEKGLGG
ncbi:hypothetical protein BLNAU_24249 [Blattamonas nauphoetae]|uniref:Uncharacterized protein n=1 Tax=Blattamonas nauphoetae TaxID=2049346 RepID=A0ABQ9WN15_9EUKA|nr:hypothetical protein BLNAU_24249 [Blattamonas nauphoetae]